MDPAGHLPFDGAISHFRDHDAPQEVRAALAAADGPILAPPYPYSTPMAPKPYASHLHQLQIQLARLQAWVRDSGARTIVVFEGRDAAGKGGTIKRIRENLNPRIVRVVALPKPSPREAGQWYFQRYTAHLPAEGEIVLFDRSWYNRAIVEPVFGFCTEAERARFFTQVPGFERALVDDGITLIKIWLDVGRAEQLRRFLRRERDPLKQWKLSPIDVEGLGKWSDYTHAIGETFAATHSAAAPWTVILGCDKRRARIAAAQTVLLALPFVGRDDGAIGPVDPQICGCPDLWHA